MVTFKPVVFHQSRPKDGNYNVKIRVTFKGVSRFLPTTLFCNQAELTRQGRIKQCNTLSRAVELCDRMRQALSDVSPFTLESQDVDWVVRHIRNSMQVERFSLDFFEWADQVIQTKKESTGRIYGLAVNSFRRYVGDSLDINEITATMVKEFIAWVNVSPVSRSAGRGKKNSFESNVPHHAGAGERKAKYLAYIFSLAQEKYNDEDSGRILIPRHPFGRVKKTLPPAFKGQKSIGVAGIQMLIDLEPDGVVESRARDCFLISFLLMGANTEDLFRAMPPKAGVWEYNRAKTKDRRVDKARMRVYVQNELHTYVDKYLDQTGKRWLNLWQTFSTTASLTNSLNAGLKSICERCGLEHFTMYAARKSWGTIARSIGIEKATIDEGLDHVGDFKLADIYIEKNWDIINEANRKVIDLFRWPE